MEIDEKLKPFVNNYKMNLYDYHEHNDFSVFKTENRALFEALSCANNKKKMLKLLNSRYSSYSRLDEESAKAILGIIGERIDLGRIKEVNENNKEVYNVCKAFYDYKEEGRREGRRMGIREGELKALRRSLKNLMNNQKIGLEETMKMLGILLENMEMFKT